MTVKSTLRTTGIRSEGKVKRLQVAIETKAVESADGEFLVSFILGELPVGSADAAPAAAVLGVHVKAVGRKRTALLPTPFFGFCFLVGAIGS